MVMQSDFLRWEMDADQYEDYLASQESRREMESD
jgi:hypothetical protein